MVNPRTPLVAVQSGLAPLSAVGRQEPTGRSCPRCQRRTDRVARHWFDRVLSVFMPVARYRCANADCGWEGLLLRRRRMRLLAAQPMDSTYRAHPPEGERLRPNNPPPQG